MSDCCNEVFPLSLMRRAAAQAGSGLPAIEPGMPIPAGTGLDRRSFSRALGRARARRLRRRRAGARAFDHGIAQALAAGGPDTVLVSVFLDGGADNLSLLFPHGDPDYRKLRPKLALPDSGLVFPEDTRLRWHPSASAFHTLHSEGKLSVLPAVGLHGRRPVALHVAALLGGRRHERAASRPAGSAATSTASEATTTRFRA